MREVECVMVSVRYAVFGLAAVALLAVTAGAAIEADGIVLAQNRQPQPRPTATAQRQPQAAQPAAPAAQPAQQPAPPPAPLRTEINRFDHWTVTCSEFSEGPRKRVCSAQLQVTQQNTNNVVLAWTVGFNNENQIVSVINTPTGVSIAPGVELRLAKATVRKLPFVTCESQRCTASIPMDSNLVRDISAVAAADVVIYAPNGSGVKFNFPLKGFDKAYAELTR
jgi:invasion protein IalB